MSEVQEESPDELIARLARETCARKVKFKTEFDAQMARRKLAIPRPKAYLCQVCGSWHLGHPTNKNQRRKR